VTPLDPHQIPGSKGRRPLVGPGQSPGRGSGAKPPNGSITRLAGITRPSPHTRKKACRPDLETSGVQRAGRPFAGVGSARDVTVFQCLVVTWGLSGATPDPARMEPATSVDVRTEIEYHKVIRPKTKESNIYLILLKFKNLARRG